MFTKQENEKLLEQYHAWLISRARMLVSMFCESYDDCYQSLVLNLLKYRTQRIAWLETKKNLERERNLHATNKADRQSIHTHQQLASGMAVNYFPDLSDYGNWPTDLKDAVSKLYPDEKAALAFYLAGKTLEEAAEKLSISKSKCSQLTNYAKKTIEEHIANCD